MNRILWASILSLVFASDASAEPAIPKLVTTYQTDPTLCAKVRALESIFAGCDMPDKRCFEPEIRAQWFSVVPAQEVATNQYGYTQMFVSRPTGKSYAIAFLLRFDGDRHPLLIETWKVNAEQLSELTNMAPRPLSHESWVKGGHGITRETLADEFATVLSRGEKLSDDWCPAWMPVIRIEDTDYLLTRECAGLWGYGGYYQCNEVIKVKVKRITDAKSVPVCEYSK